MRLNLGSAAASLLAVSLLVVGTPWQASAPVVGEPYGGCKEGWRYPGTPGHAWCVEHGWDYEGVK
jgi:hypothetical protein